MTLPSFLTLILTEIGWNLAVWLPTVLLSLLFIRLVLGVPMRELVAEIEDHQTAAIGAVFFWASLGFALLFSRVVAAPAPLTELSWSQAFVWLGMAVGLSLLLFSLGVWLVFGTLARRKGESVSGYLRRELVAEHNLALSFILGSLFLVPVVVAYHVTM
ncbi:hypothetical protein [Deinococcus radiophilus]|uniref:DUF350 domain-containing protein n=1 Tax=Deinococcus radiophilus TaxID=32062 RepID=A0A431VX35_9DEIO|nr:hypothetical protein [Deinococcus radiophilus]RTR27750.1 hypothetical protein EJ104_06085 [Deinococcus radiophilus]UFA50070.1 hypothetical protein LMT64_09305 [Deinococcus radiophilus]